MLVAGAGNPPPTIAAGVAIAVAGIVRPVGLALVLTAAAWLAWSRAGPRSLAARATRTPALIAPICVLLAV